MEPTYTSTDLTRAAKSGLLDDYILGCNPTHRTLKNVEWNIRHAHWGISLSARAECAKCGAIRTTTIAL